MHEDAFAAYDALRARLAAQAPLSEGFVRKGILFGKGAGEGCLVLVEFNKLRSSDEDSVQFNLNSGLFLPGVHARIDPEDKAYSVQKKVLPRQAIWHFHHQVQPTWGIRWSAVPDSDLDALANEVAGRLSEWLADVQPLASVRGMIQRWESQGTRLSLVDAERLDAARSLFSRTGAG